MHLTRTLVLPAQTIRGAFADTGGFHTYQTIDLGTVTLSKPGINTITLSPDKMKSALCNLRELPEV